MWWDYKEINIVEADVLFQSMSRNFASMSTQYHEIIIGGGVSIFIPTIRSLQIFCERFTRVVERKYYFFMFLYL